MRHDYTLPDANPVFQCYGVTIFIKVTIIIIINDTIIIILFLLSLLLLLLLLLLCFTTDGKSCLIS